MGPFLLLNAALVGFFGFASIYHLILWATSRRETLLGIFGMDCAVRAVFSGVVMAIATSETVAEAQSNLHARIALGILMIVTWVWCLSLISDVRARWFVWPITGIFLALFLLHVFVVPLNANVDSVEHFVLPWGETIANPKLERPGWWFGPIYTIVISIELFGFYCGSRLWTRDRVAGTLILSATCTLLLLHTAHLLKATGVVDLPFIGSIGHVFWAGMVGLVIARRNLQMQERLAASERQFRGIFDQTFQFLGLLSTDGRLIAANRTALEFAGVREEDVIGKPFWQSPWWSHSPNLQHQVRQAIRDAASGQTIRFEATHPRADGKLTQFDFSLKPLRNERGEITLLIPEGRDISERKQFEISLQKRLDELTILNRIGVICSKANTPDELLHRVTEVIAEIRSPDNLGFLLVDPVQGVLITHPSFVRSDPNVIKADTPLGIGITGQVAQSGQPRRLGDVRQDPGYLPVDSRTRSELCLPMRIGANVVGVLNVESQERDAFTDADEQLLSTVVDITGNALERLRAEERIRENRQFLSSVSQALPSWIYIFDFDLRGVVYSNRSLLGDLGYPPARHNDRLSLSTIAEHIASSDLNHLERLLDEWQALPDGQLRDDVYQLRHADGTVRSFAGREIVFSRRSDGTIRQILGTIADITLRRRAEESLRESEERYRHLVENAPYCIYELDASGRFISMNSAGLRMMDLDNPVGIVGTHYLDMVDGSDRPRISQLLQVATAGGSSSFEFAAVNGRCFSSSLVPLAGDKIMGITRDITDQKRAQEALRESEERFRAFVEHGFEGINIVDAQGTLVYAGPGNKSLLGHAAVDVCGRSAFETVHPDDLTEVQSTWIEILHHPEQSYRHRLRALHQDGSWHWMEVRACNLLHHPAVCGIVVNWQDITDRKIAEDKLHESEERKAAVFESALDALITIDGTGKIVEWNPAAETIFGYTQQQAIGREMAELIIPSRLRQSHRDGIARFLASGEGPVIRKLLELPATRSNGAEFPAEVYITPIRSQSPLFSGFIRDITERKQAEEERRNLESQILRTQKLESLGVLAGGIAHDFNNLLTVMLGNASLALMQLPDEAPASLMVREIEQAARRAAELTQQMLAYSGKGKFVIQRLRLDDLVQETTKLLKTVVSRNATVKLDLKPAAIEGDATQIRQLVMNLVINASDALEDNAATIHIRTGTRTADVAELRSPFLPDDLPAGEYAFVEVADTGCGMAEQTQARIFDPFFTTKFAGRGLGLAAVLGIVRGHRGTIKLDTSPGNGTVFQVLFPCADMIAVSDINSGGEELLERGRGTVLVFDDELIIHSFVRNVLESAGFEVLTVVDGQEGLQLLVEHSPTIVAVLLDLTMPRMDGLEVLRELRNLSPDVPVLVMSGYNDQEVAIRCAGTGARGFIQKPFDPRDLIARLFEVLMPEPSL